MEALSESVILKTNPADAMAGDTMLIEIEAIACIGE